jgi:dihydropteroate synthase
MEDMTKATGNNFENTIREYLKQGREKLENDLTGTREAMKIIAGEKTRDFIRTMDKGLDKNEREFLSGVIISSMYQAFSYGYGIGKVEGKTNKKVFI